MIDYEPIIESALGAIREAGTRIPVRRVVRTVNPVTEVTTETVTHSGELDVVVLPAKKANALAGFATGFDNAYVEKLRAGKVRSLLGAALSAPFEPQAGDVCDFEGRAWSLLGCTPLSPSGKAIIYKMEVSRV
jgi:hypothetical protein